MKKSLLIVCALVFATIAQSVHAKDVLLVKSTVQGESRVLNLVLMLDNNSDITAFRLDEINGGKIVDTDTYRVSGPTEFVLFQEEGRDVINLVSDNFSGHQGGDVVLDYLYNGITKSRGSLDLDLSRNGDKWELSKDGRTVKSLHFVKNKKMFVGVIGIKYIQVN